MNTTSKDISKRLYELSGWGDRCEVYFSWQTKYDKVITTKEQGAEDSDGFLRPWAVPAYNLGFLLRKIPANTSIYDWVQIGKHEKDYEVSWWIETDFIDSFSADTPEDAVAKLCIQLFESSILKKGE